MNHIVFVTLFLGLVSGRQWLDMRADPAVKSIVVTLDGREVAKLAGPPWHAAIDLGARLEPKRLVATGFTENGEPIASGSQLVNVPRPVAEAQILVERHEGARATLKILGRHREALKPKSARAYFDGAPLRVSKNLTATLPEYDVTVSHSVAAELKFRDGTVAVSEVVLEGGFSISADAQLTPIAVRPRAPGTPSLDGCFSAGEGPVRATWDDSDEALVIVVKDPDAREVRYRLDPTNAMGHRGRRGEAMRAEAPLDPGTKTIWIWPVSGRYMEPGVASSRLFPHTDEFPASRGGMRWILAQGAPKEFFPFPRQYADAVAVAGSRALRSGRRRVVVLLLGKKEDVSQYMPEVVRGFLATIGVPLLVWSADGPRTDLSATWGPVDDVSTDEGLAAATKKLRDELASQRIVWLSADPLDALRVNVANRCMATPLTKRGSE